MRYAAHPRGHFPDDLAERQANYTQHLRDRLDADLEAQSEANDLAHQRQHRHPCSRPGCPCLDYDPGAGHHDKPACANCGHREDTHQ